MTGLAFGVWPSSVSRERTYSSSLAVSAKALYSASVEERATERCFQELQEMGVLPRYNR